MKAARATVAVCFVLLLCGCPFVVQSPRLLDGVWRMEIRQDGATILEDDCLEIADGQVITFSPCGGVPWNVNTSELTLSGRNVSMSFEYDIYSGDMVFTASYALDLKLMCDGSLQGTGVTNAPWLSQPPPLEFTLTREEH